VVFSEFQPGLDVIETSAKATAPKDGARGRIGRKAMIDFLTKNFALVSAAITILSACMVMVFLFAYLSVFDWNLIWIVEYSDIIKFSLIGVAFISGSAFFVFTIFHHVQNWLIFDIKLGRTAIIVVLAMFVLLLAIDLYNDIYVESNPTIEYHIYLFLSYVFLILFAISFMEIYKVKAGENISFWWVGQTLCSLIILIGFFGRTYGLRIRDISDIRHEVIMREQGNWRHIFGDATIVLLTSHHTILKVGSTIVTLPSNDVAQIVALTPKP
jgi:hypothetical protein